MVGIGKNILSNAALQAWLALSQVLLVPLYIHYLGIEAYGLVGFYASIQAIFFIFDFGFSATLNQELARPVSNMQGKISRADLIRSMELLFLILASTAALLIVMAAPWLSRRMISDSVLDPDVITWSIRLMGILVGTRLPIGLYTGALNGLERQLRLNLILIASEVLRFLSIIICLVWFWNHIFAFFYIQIVFSFLTWLFLRYELWKTEKVSGYVPNAGWAHLASGFRFTAGVAGVSIVSVMISQIDKILISGLVSLEQLGYYTLAFAIAAIPSKFVGPVANAFYPRMVKAHALNNPEQLWKVYQQACQLVALIIVPVSFCLIFFADSLLVLWLRDPDLTGQIANMVRIFTVGFMLNGVMTMPYFLQLTERWTSLSFFKNLLASLILIPFLFFVTKIYGIVGASFLWLILNFSYVVIEIPMMHKRLFPDMMGYWYRNSFLKPVLWGSAMNLLLYLILHPLDLPPFVLLLILVGAFVIMTLLINRMLPSRPLLTLIKHSPL